MRFRAGYHAPAATLLLVVAGAGEVAIAARAVPHGSLEVAVAPAPALGGSMMAFLATEYLCMWATCIMATNPAPAWNINMMLQPPKSCTYRPHTISDRPSAHPTMHNLLLAILQCEQGDVPCDGPCMAGLDRLVGAAGHLPGQRS